jgi:hypothetical protein
MVDDRLADAIRAGERNDEIMWAILGKMRQITEREASWAKRTQYNYGVGSTRKRREDGSFTICPNGHEYTEANTAHRPDGSQRCLTCYRAAKERQRRKKEVRERGEGPSQ